MLQNSKRMKKKRRSKSPNRATSFMYCTAWTRLTLVIRRRHIGNNAAVSRQNKTTAMMTATATLNRTATKG